MAEDELVTVNSVRERTAKAEQFSTVATSISVPLVQFGSLAAVVLLGVLGYPWVATVAATPFVGVTITQLTIVFRHQSQSAPTVE